MRRNFLSRERSDKVEDFSSHSFPLVFLIQIFQNTGTRMKILDNSGTEFQFLEGVLICVPKRHDSEMFDSPEYVFARTNIGYLNMGCLKPTISLL